MANKTCLSLVFDRASDAKTAKRVVELLADKDYDSELLEEINVPENLIKEKEKNPPRKSILRRVAGYLCGHK